MNLRMFFFGAAGLAGFIFFMLNAMSVFKLFRDGNAADISGQQIMFALAGFVTAGVFGALWEHARTSAQNNAPPEEEKSENIGSKRIDEMKLMGGIVVSGLAVLEFSTRIISSKFLVPYEDTALLRNFFSSDIFPIIFLWAGILLLYGAFKPLSNDSPKSNNNAEYENTADSKKNGEIIERERAGSNKNSLNRSQDSERSSIYESENILINDSHSDLETSVKQCPMCSKTIKLQALACGFCNHTFDESEVEAAKNKLIEEIRISEEIKKKAAIFERHNAKIEAKKAEDKKQKEAQLEEILRENAEIIRNFNKLASKHKALAILYGVLGSILAFLGFIGVLIGLTPTEGLDIGMIVFFLSLFMLPGAILLRARSRRKIQCEALETEIAHLKTKNIGD